jgi:protein phosphatase
MEGALVDRVRSALEASGFWDEMNTDWVCLDCELMPWSAKARTLLLQQYAPVAASGRLALAEAVRGLEATERRGLPAGDLRSAFSGKASRIERFAAAYAPYCWDVETVDDHKLAPFHVLATEGKVHTDRDHRWHMETLARVCREDEDVLIETPFLGLDVTDEASRAEGIAWWEHLTSQGGEGMVVKPLEFAPRGLRRRVQPAVKCRGREYLRIIYGPDYTAPENLERLRKRGLGHKRSLAIREFALGMEALSRFVRREPLRRVHECVFGVLALESEPVDPRL